MKVIAGTLNAAPCGVRGARTAGGPTTALGVTGEMIAVRAEPATAAPGAEPDGLLAAEPAQRVAPGRGLDGDVDRERARLRVLLVEPPEDPVDGQGAG